MRKYARNGECYPRGYRMAWYDFMRRQAVCYPLGIHVIAWAIHELWQITYWRMPEAEKAQLLGQIDALKHDRQRLYGEIDKAISERDAACGLARVYQQMANGELRE